jgi:hypothetical protein
MRVLCALVFFCLAAFSLGEAQYLALYLQGNKIGYSEYVNVAEGDGHRSDNKTVMETSLLGTPVTIEMRSTTWSGKDGRPARMTFEMSSAGRTQKVDARFEGGTVHVNAENAGQRTSRTLTVPAGGTVVDDPLALVLAGEMTAGATRTFYVLDPTTVALLKNDVKVVGPAKAEVQGRSVDATLIEITDPRATMSIYLDAKGDLLLAKGPMGIEMLPVSKAIALAPPGQYAPSIDLAYATSLRTDKPITDPDTLKTLELRVTAKNLNSVPSDEHQTSRKDGDAWVLNVHPVQFSASRSGTIVDAARAKPEWVKPSLHIPSEAPRFRNLARQIVGERKDVHAASLAIHRHVYGMMKPNAGIGVLRDATDVLETREGVCRDYAILTVTLLRAAGIPARLASGLVNWDGTFYYHAWAEAWDGSRWIGIDTTTPREQLTAAHVKLGDGNVEQAFTFTFLDAAKIEVLGLKRK